MKILVINGPNLNMLGAREKEVYGERTLADINAEVAAFAAAQGMDTAFFQSNCEGELCEAVQQSVSRYKADGIVLNADTRIYTMISEKAKTLADIKLNDTLISILILSFFCGILMYLAVNTYKEVKDIGKYLAVFLGVIVFILCGFEHCIANMYYFSVSSTWSLNTLLYLLVMILGNSLGGILIPLCNKVIKKG